MSYVSCHVLYPTIILKRSRQLKTKGITAQASNSFTFTADSQLSWREVLSYKLKNVDLWSLLPNMNLLYLSLDRDFEFITYNLKPLF